MPWAGTSVVYIWEAIVTTFPGQFVKPQERFGILWQDGSPMAGFYALAKLMAPIPRGAYALRGSTNTDMATAVFRSNGQIVVAIVNDGDVSKQISVTVNNVQVADSLGTSVWTDSLAADDAVRNSVTVGLSEQGFRVTVTMTVDSLITLTFTTI